MRRKSILLSLSIPLISHRRWNCLDDNFLSVLLKNGRLERENPSLPGFRVRECLILYYGIIVQVARVFSGIVWQWELRLCLTRLSSFENFQVVLDNPSNIFFTGQRVEGRVIVAIIIKSSFIGIIALVLIMIIPRNHNHFSVIISHAQRCVILRSCNHRSSKLSQ